VNPLCSEIDSITHFWCDCMADDFFTSHPDIDDVLLLIDFTPAYILDTGEKSPAIPIKMWLASK
jgi:hypothetical protein